ncbi:unnamed protein product [Diamesa serratosioi]
MGETCTDTFNFASYNIFESIKDSLPEGIIVQIFDVLDDLLFLWDFKDSTLLVLNWRAAQSKGGEVVRHQTLIPSANHNFIVNKVTVSIEGSFVAISGQHGVSIMEMPRRWGANGLYQDGKSKITCQTCILVQHSSNHLDVLQTRWHPGSQTDSHLLVLMSDNSILMYDESNLKQIWRVGPIPNNSAVEKNFSYLQSLGDTAVDFDIAPAKVLNGFNDNSELDIINNSINSLSISKTMAGCKVEQRKVEWPIVVLRGNGTIFTLIAGLNTPKPRLQGPLTMIPRQNDNYGDDSCSLIVIPTLPPTIVIAESTGTLHHILMIESTSEDSSFDETKIDIQNEYDLYVLETIALELGLPEDKNTPDTHSNPIYLKRDLVNEERYYCYHDTGLHGITIGFVPQLQGYINDDEVEPNMNIKSRAEYILSTKAFNTSKSNAIIGLGMLHSPTGMLAILKSGQIISLDVVLDKTLFNHPNSDVRTVSSQYSKDISVKKNLNGSFDQYIRNILTSDVTQPILKLDKTNPPTAQQSLDLLMNAMQVLRENNFPKHDKVCLEILKRMNTLEIMKNQQKEEITQLFNDKEQIQEKAYKLADMHEDIMEKRNNLNKRIQDILRLATLRLPTGTSSEKEFTDQIKRIKSRTDQLLQAVQQIKAKNEIQKTQFECWNESNEDTMKALPPKQEQTIKEILADMTSQIAPLTGDIMKIKSILDI